MICPVCKNQTSDGSKFCQVCGAPILQSDIRQNNNGQPHPQQQPRPDVGQQPRPDVGQQPRPDVGQQPRNTNSQPRPQQQSRPDWDQPHPQQNQAVNRQQSRPVSNQSYPQQDRPMNGDTQYNESANNSDRSYYQRGSTIGGADQQQNRHRSMEYDEYSNESYGNQRKQNYGGGYNTPDIGDRLDGEDWQPYRIWLWLLLSYVTCGISDIILMFKIKDDLADITGSVRNSDKNITIVTVIQLICRITMFPLLFLGGLPRTLYAAIIGTSIQDAFDSLGERKNYALEYMGLAAYTIVPLPVLAAADINYYAGYGKGSKKIAIGYLILTMVPFLLYIGWVILWIGGALFMVVVNSDSTAATQVIYTLV